MAETNETEHPPQTNGLPEENEEDDKSKMRPADIDAVSFFYHFMFYI